MKIEYEVKFLEINITEMTQVLRKYGRLHKKQFLQKRAIFSLPKDSIMKSGWIRVRDESTQITLALKSSGDTLEDQKETEIIVSDFSATKELLYLLGCKEEAYQENKREIWVIGDVEVTIDIWPYLDPFIEIEGKSEDAIKQVASILGFDFQYAVFGSVDKVYAKKYALDVKTVNEKIASLAFASNNPFIDASVAET